MYPNNNTAASTLQSLSTLPQRQLPQLPQVPGALTSLPVATTAPAKTVSAEEVAKPTREAVEQAAKHIESFVKSVGRSLDFSVDSSTGLSVLRVVNPESGEVVRQLPAEETLRVAAAIDYMQSILVNQRA
jgi:flagellar protein FlaG